MNGPDFSPKPKTTKPTLIKPEAVVIQCDSDVPAGNRTAIAGHSEANDGDRWIGRGPECESCFDQSIH